MFPFVAKPTDRDLSAILKSTVKDFVYALDRHGEKRLDMIEVRHFLSIYMSIYLHIYLSAYFSAYLSSV